MAARILLVSGSTRSASTNTAALRVMRALAPDGVTAELYEGLADLPAFNPDEDVDPAHPAVAELRRRLDAAEVVVFCSPEYAGTVPGSLKNLIDWTVGSGELYRKSVAYLNVANKGRGEGAQATLAMVLGYVDADVIEPACVRLTVARDTADAERVADANLRGAIAGVYQAILRHLDMRRQA